MGNHGEEDGRQKEGKGWRAVYKQNGSHILTHCKTKTYVLVFLTVRLGFFSLGFCLLFSIFGSLFILTSKLVGCPLKSMTQTCSLNQPQKVYLNKNNHRSVLFHISLLTPAVNCSISTIICRVRLVKGCNYLT